MVLLFVPLEAAWGIIMEDLKSEDKKKIMEEIHYFFKEEHNLDLGYIGQENIYNFFMETIGTYVYNAALDDARKFYSRQWENAESDFYALYKDN